MPAEHADAAAGALAFSQDQVARLKRKAEAARQESEAQKCRRRRERRKQHEASLRSESSSSRSEGAATSSPAAASVSDEPNQPADHNPPRQHQLILQSELNKSGNLGAEHGAARGRDAGHTAPVSQAARHEEHSSHAGNCDLVAALRAHAISPPRKAHEDDHIALPDINALPLAPRRSKVDTPPAPLLPVMKVARDIIPSQSRSMPRISDLSTSSTVSTRNCDDRSIISTAYHRPQRSSTAIHNIDKRSSTAIHNIDKRKVINNHITNTTINHGTSGVLPLESRLPSTAPSRPWTFFIFLGVAVATAVVTYKVYDAGWHFFSSMFSAMRNPVALITSMLPDSVWSPLPFTGRMSTPTASPTPRPSSVVFVPIQTPHPYLSTLISSGVAISNMTGVGFPFSGALADMSHQRTSVIKLAEAWHRIREGEQDVISKTGGLEPVREWMESFVDAFQQRVLSEQGWMYDMRERRRVDPAAAAMRRAESLEGTLLSWLPRYISLPRATETSLSLLLDRLDELEANLADAIAFRDTALRTLKQEDGVDDDDGGGGGGGEDSKSRIGAPLRQAREALCLLAPSYKNYDREAIEDLVVEGVVVVDVPLKKMSAKMLFGESHCPHSSSMSIEERVRDHLLGVRAGQATAEGFCSLARDGQNAMKRSSQNLEDDMGWLLARRQVVVSLKGRVWEPLERQRRSGSGLANCLTWLRRQWAAAVSGVREQQREATVGVDSAWVMEREDEMVAVVEQVLKWTQDDAAMNVRK